MKILETRTEITGASFTNKIQEMQEITSGIEDMIQEINTFIKESDRKIPGTKYPSIWDPMKRQSLWIIGIMEGKEKQVKGSKCYQKIIDNIPNVKK